MGRFENYPKTEMEHASNIKLTTEELKTLKECQYNATVHRGLPLSIFTTSGVYCLMKSGILNKNKINLIITGFAGFIIGVISYRQTCVDKLFALPNSTLKDRILTAQRKHQNVRIEVEPQDRQSQSWFEITQEQEPMISSLDIGPFNETYNFSDSSTKLIDAETAYMIDPPLKPVVGSPYTTYDDLRRRNREQYENKWNPKTSGENNTVKQQSDYRQSLSYANENNNQPLRSNDFSS